MSMVKTTEPGFRNLVIIYLMTVVALSCQAGSLSDYLADYERLEYVQTSVDGGEYVDTGYKPSPTDRVETMVRFTGDVTGNQGVFCSRKTNQYNVFECLLASGNMRFDHYDHQTATPSIYHQTASGKTDIAADTDYEIVMDGNTKKFSLNGVTSTSTLNLTMNNATVTNFFLFTFGNNGASSGPARSCRMYYFRVYNASGALACALLPVQRKSDGVAGFLDTVSGRFVTALQGSLTGCGGFKPVDYVATSSNGGEYVKTGYWPATNDCVRTKVRFTGDVSGTPGIFCSRKNHSSNNFSCLLANGNMRFDLQHNNNNHNVFHQTSSGKTTIVPNTDYEIVMNGGTKKFSLNGVESTSSLLGMTASTVIDFWLFVLTQEGAALDSSFAKSCRMYNFKVYGADGQMKVDLTPVRRQSDGVAGLFDDVRGGFVTSPTGALQVPHKGLMVIVR